MSHPPFSCRVRIVVRTPPKTISRVSCISMLPADSLADAKLSIACSVIKYTSGSPNLGDVGLE